MDVLVSFSTSFEYLCYGFADIEIIISFSAGIVFGRQNLTSKDGQYAERVKNELDGPHNCLGL